MTDGWIMDAAEADGWECSEPGCGRGLGHDDPEVAEQPTPHGPMTAPDSPTPDGRPNPGCRMSTIDGDLFVSLDDLYRFMEWVIEVSGPDGEILFGGALRLIRENFADATPAPAHPGGERPAGEWTAVDLLADLNDRAERAMVELEKRAAAYGSSTERTRLLGKLSGLALVADWLRSYPRPTDPTGSEA